jgi:4-hydroxyacetophenone monooxygenase
MSGQKDSTRDQDWLVNALTAANLPTLCCLLVHLTGDRSWIEGEFVPSRTRGLDDNDSGGFSLGVKQKIRDAAYVALTDWLSGKSPALPNPTDELLVEMMSASLGEVVPQSYAPMIRKDLALSENSVASPISTPANSDFCALIIGAGISGLCAAIEFEGAGIPYTIVERHNDLGGVWFENRYPGAACDVPSYLYSFSFAAYDWSRFFAGSSEIHNYLESVADRYDIRRHIRFGLEVVEARFDEISGKWETSLIDANGTQQLMSANLLISGVGAFNKPRLPNIPGLADFKGPSVHTACYPEEGIDLEGRNVILIGNGASAMQVAPAIADKVASLTIVQRTPQWAAPFPKFGQDIPGSLRRLLIEVPLYRLWYRLRLSWAFNDKLYEALQQDTSWDGGGRSINAINDAHRVSLEAYIKSELGSAINLLPEVLPGYPPFGKRMLLDNGWFRTMAQKKVKLVTGSVVEAHATGVTTTDGKKHEADVLIWATGFDVVNLLAPMKVIGLGGRELHDDWNGDDARAYLGTVVPGYPNFFCLYGPNTQFGHGGSLITVLERQMHYVMSLVRQMLEKGATQIEVDKHVHDAYNEKVDSTHARMVWTYPGVETYYKNSKGRVVVNNPFRILEYWQMTETADLTEFKLGRYALDPTETAVA